MDYYRLKIRMAEGGGVITINGNPPEIFYEALTVLSISVTLDAGFNSVEWFRQGVSLSTSTTFNFTMPESDVSILGYASGAFQPVDGYGLKYYRESKQNKDNGACVRLEIYQDGYGGSDSEIEMQSCLLRFGTLGGDILDTIVGSSLDFTLVGTNDQFKEFLIGDYRTWKTVLKVGLETKFTGYITPDFVTINDQSGQTIQTFTAVDGMKGFDSIRVQPTIFPGTPRDKAFNALIGSLNQTFVEFRNVNMACQLHETRMYQLENVWEQFYTPEASEFTEGVAQFTSGSVTLNNTLFISETLKALLKPFLARVFLWDEEFWIIRTGELAKNSYTAFKYLPDATLDDEIVVTNGTDIECDINFPEITARRVYNEFTVNLNLGRLNSQAKGGVFEATFAQDNWLRGLFSTPLFGIYYLRDWDYVNAGAINQPNFTPSGDVAGIQYDSRSGNEGVKIWTTTTTAGLLDPNISYILHDTSDALPVVQIAQENANKISFQLEFMVDAVTTVDPGTFTNHKVGIKIQIGTKYLYRIDATTFGWTATDTIMTFDVTNQRVFNSISISNVVVPETGEIKIYLYQLILTTGTRHQYAIIYRNLKLTIEENEALTLATISTKAITDNPYSNVHPDYDTTIGDSETNVSTSAIKLDLAGQPVSENWTRDGVESLPLMSIIAQDLANLKGRTNERLMGDVVHTEVKPYQSYAYNGNLWAITAMEWDVLTDVNRVELFNLGEIPTT
jgi:hypothetical protein